MILTCTTNLKSYVVHRINAERKLGDRKVFEFVFEKYLHLP